MKAVGLTDVGKVREVNQDSFVTIDLIDLYMVADGMGGHAAGEKASMSAVSTALEIFSVYDFETKKLPVSDVKLEIIDVIKLTLKEANNRIIQTSISSINMQGMGTTGIISVYRDNKIYMGHVGDSRSYMIKGGEIEQVTKDHSVVQDLKDQGVITEEEAKVHPYKNVITRCLGMQPEVDIDLITLPFEPGSKLLMCSDGLTNLVSDEEIKNLINSSDDLEKVCQTLIDKANERGGHDNITTVLLHNDGSI